jgi:hypothetical protein
MEIDMGEIAELLQQKAGLSPDKAQEVEEVVVEHIMSRVPSEFQGVVGSVLGAGATPTEGQPSAESGGLGSLLSAASGMFEGSKG